MRKHRIVDLSLPIIDGGGFGRSAKLNYYNHQQRGENLANAMGFDAGEIDNRASLVAW